MEELAWEEPLKLKNCKFRKSKGIGLNQCIIPLSALKGRVQRYQILCQVRSLIVKKSIWLILEEFFFPIGHINDSMAQTLRAKNGLKT